MAETNNEDHGGRERFPKLPDADAPKGADDQRVWNETLAQFSTAQKTLNAAEALMPPAHESRGELHEKRHPPSNDREYLKKISAEERLRMLSSQLGEGKELTPEQTLRIQEIDLVESFAEVMAASRSHDIPAVQAVYGGPLQWIRERRGDLVLLLVRHPDESLKNILPNHFLGLFEKMDISLDPALEPQEILARQNFLVKLARENRCYAVAEDVMNKALDEEFKQGERQISAAEKDKMRTDAKNTIDRELKRRHGEKEGWAEKGIDAQLIDRLTEREYQHSLHSEIASRFLGKTIQFTGEKAELWEQYRDMLDPHGELRNPKDSTWDTIRDELISNAPLILVSGGVASLMRAGVSLTAREFIIGKVGEAAFKKLAQKTAMKAAATVSGTLVEGAAFDVISKILHGEWYKDLPDFAKSVLWSSATLGLFHGAGKLGERFFSKEVMMAGEKLTVRTALGNAVSHIKNPAVQEAAKQLMVKGHMEAATMLLVSAVQNGVYEGNLDEFFHNFGDEILHAYVSVGALKIGGAVAGKAAKKMFGDGGETKPPRQDGVAEKTKRPPPEKVDAKDTPSTPNLYDRLGASVSTFKKKFSALPPETSGPNEIFEARKRLMQAMSPEEQALPSKQRNAILRRRLKAHLREVADMAGRVMDRMETFVRTKPEATYEEIMAETQRQEFNKLPAATRRNLRIAALRIEHNRETMQTALREFSPPILFEKLFGFKPKGAVAIKPSPFCIQFVVDPVDLVVIDSPSLRHESEANLKRDAEHFKTGGFVAEITGELSSLNGLIVLARDDIPAKINDFLRHEEMHVIDNLVTPPDKNGVVRERSIPMDKAERFLASMDNVRDFPTALRLFKEAFMDKARDEIIAHMKEGISAEAITRRLTQNDAYDYSTQYKDSILRRVPTEYAETARQLYDEMVLDYKSEVADATGMAHRLAGNTSGSERNEILRKLGTTPIKRWLLVFNQ